jgi:multidrug resistance efflux pump
MATAKAINLRVRPLQSVDLCFQVDGIVGDQSEIHLLGKQVAGFDLPSFYGTLGQPVSPANLARLKFDSQAIRNAVLPSVLFELRAEPVKAALDKAIAQRENMYLQKYNNQANIIARMQNDYGSGASSKTTRLAALATVSTQQHDALDHEYQTDGKNHNAVVKLTTSDTTGANTTKAVTSHTTTPTNTVTTSNPGASSTTTGGGSTTTTTSPGSTTTTTTPASTSNTTTDPSETDILSHTDNMGYDYRHPSFENDAQFQRAQVSLLDEQFAQFMFSQNLPFLDTVFNNELKSIDLDVKRLQVAYLDTLLVSPIAGIVTGVFRDKGDSVRSGQAVMRVENDQEILLVGTLKFRGLLSIGARVAVTTKIFDSPNLLRVTGSIVSVRGHDSEDEEWDVLILCGNRDAHSNPIFPINYNFDFDDTTIDIS